jgi:hypothetical protein
VKLKGKTRPWGNTTNRNDVEECRPPGCDAMWLLQESRGVASQETEFFIVTTMKTSYLTEMKFFRAAGEMVPTEEN